MAGVDRMTIEEVVRKVLVEDHADVIRESGRFVAQQMMETEVSELVGAELGERRPEDRDASQRVSAEAVGHQGGRDRAADPEAPAGELLPELLQTRKRSEQALVSVVQQAYVCGISTRRVDQLVESLGLRISRSEVSRICAGLDEQVQAFRTRPRAGRYPYLFVDAKVEKVRDGGRVARKCVVVAHAVHESGRREINLCVLMCVAGPQVVPQRREGRGVQRQLA
jgi:transposase-like protein